MALASVSSLPRILLLLCVLLPTLATAGPAENAQLAELRTLRARVAGQVQLSAFNLLDELVFEWTQSAPFADPTPVFIADITVPIGLGSGLAGLLENHLSALILANPSAHVTLSHCPSCTAVMMHSGPKGTVVSRGLDNPEALAKIGGAEGRHVLYIDIAAEGAWLVLRARITKLTPDLPIVWSRTISTAVGTPSLLRSPAALKSAADARQEYLDALNNRGPLEVPVRFVIRSYSAGDSGIAPPPVLWVQTGISFAMSKARAWTASIVIGSAWLPDAYDGLMVESRISRLISGPSRSLTRPDIYLFFGTSLMSLDGVSVGAFRTENSDQLVRDAENSTSTRATFGAVNIGLELRLGSRISGSVFLEDMPAYINSDRIGVFLENGLVDFHSLGTEVTFWF